MQLTTSLHTLQAKVAKIQNKARKLPTQPWVPWGPPRGEIEARRFKQAHSWPADNLLGPNLGVFGANRKSLPICAATAALIHRRRFGTSNLCTILGNLNFLFDLIVTSVATVHL